MINHLMHIETLKLRLKVSEANPREEKKKMYGTNEVKHSASLAKQFHENSLKNNW